MLLPVKICKRCGVEKPLDDFPQKAGYRQKTCKECYNKAQKEYREKNEFYKTDYQKSRTHANKMKAVEMFGNRCRDCNQSFPAYVYDFHHIFPHEKEISPNKLMSRTWDRVLVELNKCVMLCANCHRIRHHGAKE